MESFISLLIKIISGWECSLISTKFIISQIKTTSRTLRMWQGSIYMYLHSLRLVLHDVAFVLISLINLIKHKSYNKYDLDMLDNKKGYH